MPHFWRIFWGKFASSHHQYIPLPGPLAPPLSSRPSLKITALSYSCTTLQILLDLQIAINWFWCWPWSRRKGWRAAWQGPSPKRLGWGPARRGRLQTHSRQLRWDIWRHFLKLFLEPFESAFWFGATSQAFIIIIILPSFSILNVSCSLWARKLLFAVTFLNLKYDSI